MEVSVKFSEEPLKDIRGNVIYKQLSQKNILDGLEKLDRELADGQLYAKDKFMVYFEKCFSPEPLDAKTVAVDALLGSHAGEENLDHKSKLARHNLADKINQSKGPIKIEASEAEMIEMLVGKSWSTLVLGAFVKSINSQAKK